MNQREIFVAEKYKQEGWTPLRNGAPDFIMLKVNNNNITDMMAIEVKSENGKLSYEQSIWKMICEKAQIPYRVEVVKQKEIPLIKEEGVNKKL